MNPGHLVTVIVWVTGLIGAPAIFGSKMDDGFKPLPGYHLIWSDEFNGSSLDSSQWIYRTGAAQLSFQKSENVSAANGLLRIALKKEDVGNLHYSAGGVISKREFLYAYFAARFRCPKTAGWHTSFWTVNRGTIDPSTSKPWAHRQEIDICEQDSANNHYYSAGVIDWSRTPPQGARNLGRQYFRNNTADFSAGFHIWSCEFTPEVVRFFFDGKLTHEVDAKQFPQGPHSVRLTSLALPYWPDSVKPIGVDDSHLPVYADFDWVRVYQK